MEDLTENAKLLSNAGDHDAAIMCFSLLIERSKAQNPVAFGNRGLCYFNKEMNSLAVLDFNQAISLAPTDPEWYYKRACAHMRMSDWVLALTDLTVAIELKPADSRRAEALNNRAYVLMQLGCMRHALADAQTASRMRPSDDGLRTNAELLERMARCAPQELPVLHPAVRAILKRLLMAQVTSIECQPQRLTVATESIVIAQPPAALPPRIITSSDSFSHSMSISPIPNVFVDDDISIPFPSFDRKQFEYPDELSPRVLRMTVATSPRSEI